MLKRKQNQAQQNYRSQLAIGKDRFVLVMWRADCFAVEEKMKCLICQLQLAPRAA